jgi:hypothetical protein
LGEEACGDAPELARQTTPEDRTIIDMRSPSPSALQSDSASDANAVSIICPMLRPRAADAGDG